MLTESPGGQAQRWNERPRAFGQEVPVWSDNSAATIEGGKEVERTSGELCVASNGQGWPGQWRAEKDEPIVRAWLESVCLL